MFLKIGVFMLPLVPVSIFFPLYYRLVTLFRRLPIRTVNLVSQNKCCFGTISNVFAAFIGNKNWNRGWNTNCCDNKIYKLIRWLLSTSWKYFRNKKSTVYLFVMWFFMRPVGPGRNFQRYFFQIFQMIFPNFSNCSSLQMLDESLP